MVTSYYKNSNSHNFKQTHKSNNSIIVINNYCLIQFTHMAQIVSSRACNFILFIFLIRI